MDEEGGMKEEENGGRMEEETENEVDSHSRASQQKEGTKGRWRLEKGIIEMRWGKNGRRIGEERGRSNRRRGKK